MSATPTSSDAEYPIARLGFAVRTGRANGPRQQQREDHALQREAERGLQRETPRGSVAAEG